jgi:predicted AlkP superfamily pyrophosphatase or phosphodiesterase
MRKLVLLCILVCIVFLTHGQHKETPYVIMVSFDGFRSDYVSRFNLPNFQSFIHEGAAAEGLIPSFPSKTFPNHYTLVTGLYPGHHGLVDNQFYDPAKKIMYGMRMPEAVSNPIFYGGTPLWRLAKQQGIRSASYFWVGSELEEDGLHPDYYLKYDQSVSNQRRIDQVIHWLTLPKAERPHIITLYFSSPDWESHHNGPLSEVTKQKLWSIDSLLGNFMQRIDSTKLPINVLLVSDHGMSEMVEKEDTYIFLDELIKPATRGIVTANGGTQAHVYVSSVAQKDSLYVTLTSQAKKNFTVVKHENFPARWHYDHKRSGDLLILAKQGKYIVTGGSKEFLDGIRTGTIFGAHGYDPVEAKDMYGIFYAKGPNIKSGMQIPSFENIHIYPLVAEILQLKIPAIDGNLKVLKPIYQP